MSFRGLQEQNNRNQTLNHNINGQKAIIIHSTHFMVKAGSWQIIFGQWEAF